MRTRLTAIAAAAAVPLMLAACAACSSTTPGDTAADVSSVALRGDPPAWHAGSAAQALALARHLLSELRVPPGTGPVRLVQLPPPLRGHHGPGDGWAGASQVLRAPRSPRAVWALLDSGPPFSTPAVYGPQLPTWSGVTLFAPEPGIDAAMVSVGVVPYANGTTLITAYAYAAWLPYRTPAEHIDPADYRSVTAAMQPGITIPGQTATRSFTSPVIIARLAGLLNASAPEPRGLLLDRHCAASGQTLTLRFVPKPARAPAAEVRIGSCTGIAIIVNGNPQPLLWDVRDRLGMLIHALLGRH